MQHRPLQPTESPSSSCTLLGMNYVLGYTGYTGLQVLLPSLGSLCVVHSIIRKGAGRVTTRGVYCCPDECAQKGAGETASKEDDLLCGEGT